MTKTQRDNKSNQKKSDNRRYQKTHAEKTGNKPVTRSVTKTERNKKEERPMTKAQRDNKANQKNPNNWRYQKTHAEKTGNKPMTRSVTKTEGNKKEERPMTKAQRDNKANQKNPNNWRYQKTRAEKTGNKPMTRSVTKTEGNKKEERPMTKAQRDNKANQKNPNNWRYQKTHAENTGNRPKTKSATKRNTNSSKSNQINWKYKNNVVGKNVNGYMPDEDEIKDRIRSELGNVYEEIIDALYKKFEEFYQEDDEKDVDVVLGYIQDYYDDITSSLSEGHTLTYVLTLISCCDAFDDYISVYQNMSEDEIIDDVKSVGECRGYSQTTIDDVDQMYSDGYPDDPISLMEIFEEAYNKGLEHYGDEEKAREYALACRRGGTVADFDDDFEEYLSEGEPWINADTNASDDPFPSNPSNNPFSSDYYEYSAEDILAWYNEHSDEKPDYNRGEWEFSIGCWTFTSKDYFDEMMSAPDEEE